GSVLIDMAWRLGLLPRVLTLDTGRLPQETFDMMELIRDRYGTEIEVIHPRARDVEALVRRRGPNLFHLSVDHRLACCRVRKVEPLRRALRGAGAWITGLRRDQAPTRAGTPKVAFDAEHEAWKLAPLADWSFERVDAYLRRHQVPRHPLYRKGYLSIGCAPCTRAVREGEGPRAGRWWWEEGPKECGLHLAPAVDTPAIDVPAASVPAASVPAASVPAAGVPAAGALSPTRPQAPIRAFPISETRTP
ncbi:MAG: phosphoadenylyl-sulfate reductase, partial [Holophagales bacterium]|nr:phosphoadenylyl-sulfate reductase [Holophagales bacterium]